MKIQIIVGSIREGRVAIKVADWLCQAIQVADHPSLETEIVDLKAWDLPLFAGSKPPASGVYDQPKQQAWSEKIAQGDAYILISPEYNHGYSPALKNALDYLYKEWQGKPAAFISYGGSNGSRSIDQIKQVASSLGLIDSNAVLEIRDIAKHLETGAFVANVFDEKTLKTVIDKLIHYAH